MKKKESRKIAWLLSMVALILFCSIYIGTTFAWYKDAVSSGVSVIHPGNIKVDLIDENGDSILNGGWEKKNKIVVKSGESFEISGIYVVNDGSLPFNYKILLTLDHAQEGAADPIRFSVKEAGKEESVPIEEFTGFVDANKSSEERNTSGEITIIGKLEDGAGGMSESSGYRLTMTVVATQCNEEDGR